MELEELSVVEKAAMLSGGSEWDSRGNAREAPLMEELLLETAEEPLRGRVVRRTAFRAHRTLGVEIPVRQVLRRLGGLALV